MVHRDPVSDRPSSLAHRISLMDENLVVQLGFRTRPLRDGGGKPSAGKLPPPLRRASALARLGTRIQQLTDPFFQAVRMSSLVGRKITFSRTVFSIRSARRWGRHQRMGSLQANLSSLPSFPVWPRRLETRTGNTRSLSKRGFPWE